MNNKCLMIVMCLLAAACSTPAKLRIPESFPGKPPSYRDGYVDGCTSGRAEAAHAGSKETRDLGRFNTDPAYARGWYDGSEWCRDNYQASTEDRRHDSTKAVKNDGGGW